MVSLSKPDANKSNCLIFPDNYSRFLFHRRQRVLFPQKMTKFHTQHYIFVETPSSDVGPETRSTA